MLGSENKSYTCKSFINCKVTPSLQFRVTVYFLPFIYLCKSSWSCANSSLLRKTETLSLDSRKSMNKVWLGVFFAYSQNIETPEIFIFPFLPQSITCSRHYDIFAKIAVVEWTAATLFPPKWRWFTGEHYLVTEKIWFLQSTSCWNLKASNVKQRRYLIRVLPKLRSYEADLSRSKDTELLRAPKLKMSAGDAPRLFQ